MTPGGFNPPHTTTPTTRPSNRPPAARPGGTPVTRPTTAPPRYTPPGTVTAPRTGLTPSFVIPMVNSTQELQQLFPQYMNEPGNGINPKLMDRLCRNVFADEEEVPGKIQILRNLVLNQYQSNRYFPAQKSRLQALETGLVAMAKWHNQLGIARDTAVAFAAAALVGVIPGGMRITPPRIYRYLSDAGESTLEHYNQYSDVITRAVSRFVRFFRPSTESELILKDLKNFGVSDTALRTISTRLRPVTPEEQAVLKTTYKFNPTNHKRLLYVPVKLRNSNDVSYASFVFWRRFGTHWRHAYRWPLPFARRFRKHYAARWVMYRADYVPREEAEEIRRLLISGKDQRRFGREAIAPRMGGPLAVYTPHEQLPQLQLDLNYTPPQWSTPRFYMYGLGSAALFGTFLVMYEREFREIPDTFLETLLPQQQQQQSTPPQQPRPPQPQAPISQ